MLDEERGVLGVKNDHFGGRIHAPVPFFLPKQHLQTRSCVFCEQALGIKRLRRRSLNMGGEKRGVFSG